MTNKPGQTSAVYPPLDGTIRLPFLADSHLEHNPYRTIYVYSDRPGSQTEISYLEFGRAVHRASHLLRPGRAGPDNAVVAVIANVDVLLYQTLVAGLMRAGLVIFPVSPRNSPEAILSMLTKIGCHRIVTTSASLEALMSEVVALKPAGYDLTIENAPMISQCYPQLGHESATDPFTPYPEPAAPLGLDTVFMYIHSSGSTGFPKPIPNTSRTLLSWCASIVVVGAIITLRDTYRLGGMHLPPFHIFGLVIQLLAPLTSVITVALYPPQSLHDHQLPIVPTSDSILDHSKRTGVSNISTVPSFVELWAHINLLQYIYCWLTALAIQTYASGPLARKIGDTLVHAGVKLSNVYGSTEIGPITASYFDSSNRNRAPEDWSYLRFAEDVTMRMVREPDGNSYEAQFLDGEKYRVCVHNLPDVKGFATNDLFVPHPTKPELWSIIGRRDDVLILASGENVVPDPLENTIMSSPLVRGVVVFGHGRNQAGVLLEPQAGVNGSDLTAFRNLVWPIVEEANSTSPAFSRVFKEMILVTKSGKPLPRVAKGTVAKKAAVRLYAPEIDELYETVDASAGNVDPPSSWAAVDVKSWLGVQALDVNSNKPVDADTDLFSQGFDSLSATFLRNRVIGALRASADPDAFKAARKITQNIVFSHPTLKQLSAHLVQLVSGTGAGPTSGSAAIEQMITKYSAGLATISKSTGSSASTVVLLTGSTGGLGTFLLEALLKNAQVGKVYAYNRLSQGDVTVQNRQKEAFADKAFDAALLESEKLVYVEGDAAFPNLGLSSELYEQIRSSVTIIIHNAWRLDFNLSLASFEPNIRGTRKLIDLASQSPHASTLRFLFTSSIASSQGWESSRGAFPEEVQLDAATAVGGGYGESKYVCERILAASGLHATSFRIGQITGGKPNGAWATSDWVPSFVKSSLVLGGLPGAYGVASWLPMDIVSQVILDVAMAEESPSIAMNIVHPRPSSWSAIIGSIADALHASGITPVRLAVIPFAEWFEQLEQRARRGNAEEMVKIPSTNILEFFRGMAIADAAARKSGRADSEGGITSCVTHKSQAASPTLAQAQAIGQEDAQRWVNYWISKGYL
ncbi:acetyl-CoA synthetase-like protein [Athelia psychrophila]|uniref:Acetyl-CoA synthetase-like protein n=1 Tax=Athelia psychrophila TaxID=1759441 RepID=A0A166EY28_9AGAM|nr:acetyl-CoA synthetase-like protein [Fibularhizoctonia sp. CBS 109695]